jgi:hypothetical protein
MEQKVKERFSFNNLINCFFSEDTTLQTPTTLSIEERRVQESIDRLDRQLRGILDHFLNDLSTLNLFSDVQTRTRSNSGTRLQK